MAVNRFSPHVLILPEDRANSEMANGFLISLPFQRQRQMQILPEVGGWGKVVEEFRANHIRDLEALPKRFVVLLMDFDESKDRFNDVRASIPAHLSDRVFVIGTWSEPEDLKPTLGSLEQVGRLLAEDCGNNTSRTWDHDLFVCNASELERLRQQVRPIMF